MYAIKKDIMKEIDLNTQKRIPSYDLMEDAGIKMAKKALKYYKPKKVLLVLGSGGNAGDALVLGRYFILNNIEVFAHIIDEIKNVDAKINLDKFSGTIIDDLNFEGFDLIIDGIFGIGLSRELNQKYIDIINKINESNIDIISLDIPSGIDASFGINYGAFIKSKLCITVEYIKSGMLLNDGLDSYKKIEVIKVGMDKPKDLIKIIDKSVFKNVFPNRFRNTNKGSFKKASIIAGSTNYPGASKIAYEALLSFKMGVGFSNLFVIESLYNLYALSNPEIITNKLPEIDGHIKYDENKLDEIIKRSDAISIGMGMMISEDLYLTIKYLLNNYTKKLLIDADGLNTLAKYGIDILKNKKCDVILSPHLKEFERLSNVPVSKIKEDIFNIAMNFAKEYNVILVLKSASTIITDGKNISINTTGNTALAKAGSGDGLSGILTGLLAYLDTDLYTTGMLGTYMLGKSAEYASKNMPEETLTITEIVKNVPKIVKSIKTD